MKKLIASIASLILVSGCGTTSPAPDRPAESSPVADVSAPTPMAPAVPARPAPVEVKANKYANLSKAVRLQQDESIIAESRLLLQQDSNDIVALNALAVVYQKKGQWKASELLLERALKVEPQRSDLYNNLGLISIGLNNPQKAMGQFRKAMQLNPQDGTAAANIGSLYLAQNDFVKAQAAFEIAEKKFPTEVRVQTGYALALTANKRFTQAESVLKKLLVSHPQNQLVLHNLSSLYIDNLKQPQAGLDLIARMKVLGIDAEIRNAINRLENLAQSMLK